MLHARFKIIGFLVLEEKCFTIYMDMPAILVSDLDHLYKLSFSFPKKAPQDHRTSCSGGEDFFRFLPYMGMAAILVM